VNTRDELIAFAASTAHELKNAVAAIAMAAEMALDEAPDDVPELQALLSRMQGSSTRLAALLDTLPAAASVWPISED
jgi:signal transduction histidine kinase